MTKNINLRDLLDILLAMELVSIFILFLYVYLYFDRYGSIIIIFKVAVYVEDFIVSNCIVLYRIVLYCIMRDKNNCKGNSWRSNERKNHDETGFLNICLIEEMYIPFLFPSARVLSLSFVIVFIPIFRYLTFICFVFIIIRLSRMQVSLRSCARWLYAFQMWSVWTWVL